MSETPAFLSERLRTEGEKTHTFFAGLKPDQWQTSVYTEGENWTIRSVLAHYVSAEKGFVKIFSDIRDGGSGVSVDFDIDRYNASQQRKTSDLTPAELLESFRLVRAGMIELVASLSEADLARQGRHPFLGETSLAEMIKMVYRHNQIHYRDLRKVIAEGL
jgi:uncharacterized protein (TIGR03083 family)